VTDRPARVTVIGAGELGRALLRTLQEAGCRAPRVVGRPGTGDTWRDSVVAAGGQPCATLAEAVDGAELVLVCVPARASSSVAAAAARSLAPGVVWADLASSSPDGKQACAQLIAAHGGRYVDGAVLGAVAAAGGRVPVLACGDGADLLAAWAPGLGLTVSTLDGPAGTAARVKLLRSVYLKGRDALIAEMNAAAEVFGLERVVAESIRGPGEEVAFPALAERVLASLAKHAERRADELSASSILLRSAGVAPLATEGSERRLRAWAATH